MKITCMIPTRRGDQVMGCVHAFSMLESREHEVTYAIGVDNDDPKSIEAASRTVQNYRASMSIFERQPALGNYHNMLATAAPADVYTTLGDDVICTKPGWDKAIAEAVTANPKGVWWWACPKEREAIYPIVSAAWREASGRIFTDLFSHWYDDVWLREVVIMVTGEDVPRIDGAHLVDCPMPTTRMRDLLFWDELFHACRPARVIEAKKIADALGIPRTHDEIAALSATFVKNESFRASIPSVEEAQGDKLPVTASYVASKQRAEKIMAKIESIQAAAA